MIKLSLVSPFLPPIILPIPRKLLTLTGIPMAISSLFTGMYKLKSSIYLITYHKKF